MTASAKQSQSGVCVNKKNKPRWRMNENASRIQSKPRGPCAQTASANDGQATGVNADGKASGACVCENAAASRNTHANGKTSGLCMNANADGKVSGSCSKHNANGKASKKNANGKAAGACVNENGTAGRSKTTNGPCKRKKARGAASRGACAR